MEQFCRARTDHLAYILGNFVLIFDFIELLDVQVSLFVLVVYKYISMIGSSSLVSVTGILFEFYLKMVSSKLASLCRPRQSHFPQFFFQSQPSPSPHQMLSL